MPVLAKKTRSRPLISVRRRARSAVCSVEEEVGGVEKLLRLRSAMACSMAGMTVAERGDADAAEQVKVVVAVSSVR